ncbi:MAG: hypothetical protein ACKO96_04920 [Flammeovirgaceae bacterium]
MDISQKLNIYIKKNKLTTTQLAYMLKVTEQSVRRWRKGEPFIRLDKAALLIEISNNFFTMEDFFNENADNVL